MVGVLVGSVWVAPAVVLTSGWIGSAAFYALSWSRQFSPERRARLIRLGALATLAGCFGLWRANDALLHDQEQRVRWEQWYGKSLVVRGVVREAEIRGAFVRLTVGHLTQEEEVLPGLLRTTVPKTAELGEGAVVILRGKASPPEDLRAPVRGDLERVFRRQQVFATMRFPEMDLEQPGRPSGFTNLRFRLRNTLLQQLPEPAAGLYSALLLSFDRDLSSPLREAAANTGILHLVAISGSHIAAFTAVAFLIAVTLGLSRMLAAGAALIFTAVFLTLVGFPESGVRSGLMAGLVFLALLLGRHAAGLRALLLAVVAMTAVDPRVLLGDVGLQLSALAVWGLLTIFPILQHLFRDVPDPFRIRSLFLLTVAAELATLPVVVYAFGRVPLLGPFANLAAGLLFPFLLAFGALVLLTSVVLPWATPLVTPVAAIAGNAFLAIAERVSVIPGHLLLVPPLSSSLFLLSTVGLLSAVHLLQLRLRVLPPI